MKIVENNKIPNRITLEELIPEYTCPCCGKKFVLSLGTDLRKYTYRLITNNNLTKYFCSYHCFRQVQREAEEAKTTRRAETRIKMANVIRKMTADRWEKIRSEAK